ncbi:MAG: glycerol-3-phosphate responsive antiterminator [Faecalibacterium sp.]|nr:glycerol-3-phosphate responsive antiterminator [Ruminococcus sp.]MCM1391645.1 glycerol-3-phosphate responsive antiterminator [Ruminococcus sp.]MCM1485746.1 glycerol-3-phosphate responsive antiterminator [Faecalibacterium sp.]
MKEIFAKKMKSNPIIAAVKDINNIDDAINSECEIIFLLCGNIFNLEEIVKKVREKGKLIFIHVDLIDGFSRDATALKYIHEKIKPDGIISTKNNQLKTAKELGMLTVQRLFIIDSLSIDSTVKSSSIVNPDAIEIMPGIMPRITKQLSTKLAVPVIVGGLISEKSDIINAVENGALGISTSSKAIWSMNLKS